VARGVEQPDEENREKKPGKKSRFSGSNEPASKKSKHPTEKGNYLKKKFQMRRTDHQKKQKERATSFPICPVEKRTNGCGPSKRDDQVPEAVTTLLLQRGGEKPETQPNVRPELFPGPAKSAVGKEGEEQ